MQLAGRAAAEAQQPPSEDTPKQRRPDPALLFIRAEIHKQVEPIIDEYLASDPGMVHAGAGAVIEICQEFDIPHDPARMPAQLRYPPCHEEFLLAEETNATGPPH
jgi:hypothetical protein